MEPARSYTDPYWKKYRYNDNGIWKPHNPHFTTRVRPEVHALLSLFECYCAGFVDGKVLVAKNFWFTASRSWSVPICAANEGDLDAPIEEWQKILTTLLDYAVQHGYKDPWKS